MKAPYLAALAALPSLALAGPFSFYASPAGGYSCTGYRTASCTGFEVSDPTHHIDYIKMQPWSGDPSKFLITLQMDSGMSYKGVMDPNDPNPSLVSDSSGTGVMVKVMYVTTKHCLKVCVTRYLVESGQVQ